MRVDVMISADHINEEKIKGKTVVVIDMLRATSVIVTAINNGCREVIPMLSVEETLEHVREKREEFILGGERNALKIEGFNCSNSPLEYEPKMIKDKTLVITTTNGTRAIYGSKGAKNILIGAMINAKAVAHKIYELNNHVVFVNAGTNGEFSMDDFICTGYMIKCLSEFLGHDELELSDIAYTAFDSYETHKDIKSFLEHATHYSRIRDLGLMGDLEYCCKKDIIEIVPEFKQGKILKHIC